MGLHLDLAPIAVDRIGKGLEGVERNAYGQLYVGNGNGNVQQIIDILNEKAAVLEYPQYADIHDKRQYQRLLFPLLRLGPADSKSRHVIEERVGYKHHDPHRLAPSIEQHRESQQHDIPRLYLPCNKIDQYAQGHKEVYEKQIGKNQFTVSSLLFVVCFAKTFS